MKKAIILLGLTIYSLTIYSQITGSFPASDSEIFPVYLSQNKIISNRDYPASLKDSIAKFNAGLNKAAAIEVLGSSLVKNDTLGNKDVILVGAMEDGLSVNLRVIVNDGVVDMKTENVVNGTRTTTTKAYHYELRPIFIPYSELRFIRIKNMKGYFALDCVTKVTTFKSPYYGANKFVFKIDPGTNEVSFIASLLYLCKNIKNSGFVNY